MIIGLQRTVLDGEATLRFFCTIDDVFDRLAREMPAGISSSPADGRQPRGATWPGACASAGRHGARDVHARGGPQAATKSVEV